MLGRGEGQWPQVFLVFLLHSGTSALPAKGRGLGPRILSGLVLMAEWGLGRSGPRAKSAQQIAGGWAEKRWCPAPSGKTALSLGTGGEGTSVFWTVLVWSGITIWMSWRWGWGECWFQYHRLSLFSPTFSRFS